MWGEIISYQYMWSEFIIGYLHSLDLPYAGTFMPDHLPYFDNQGLIFIVTFLVTIIVFYIGVLGNRLIGFNVYNHKKYRMILLVNLFYVFPFFYGFIGGRFNVIHIFIIFLGNVVYFGFAYILNNPQFFVDYFASIGIPL